MSIDHFEMEKLFLPNSMSPSKIADIRKHFISPYPCLKKACLSFWQYGGLETLIELYVLGNILNTHMHMLVCVTY